MLLSCLPSCSPLFKPIPLPPHPYLTPSGLFACQAAAREEKDKAEAAASAASAAGAGDKKAAALKAMLDKKNLQLAEVRRRLARWVLSACTLAPAKVCPTVPCRDTACAVGACLVMVVAMVVVPCRFEGDTDAVLDDDDEGHK